MNPPLTCVSRLARDVLSQASARTTPSRRQRKIKITKQQNQNNKIRSLWHGHQKTHNEETRITAQRRKNRTNQHDRHQAGKVRTSPVSSELTSNPFPPPPGTNILQTTFSVNDYRPHKTKRIRETCISIPPHPPSCIPLTSLKPVSGHNMANPHTGQITI